MRSAAEAEIVHTPNCQARRIDEKAPDIEVRIAINGARNSVTRCWQGSRPARFWAWMSSAMPRLENCTLWMSIRRVRPGISPPCRRRDIQPSMYVIFTHNSVRSTQLLIQKSREEAT
jgi:hypothetical protein